MTPKEAMEYLIEKGYSKYRIAKVMDMQPIMADKFLNEDVKTMRESAAYNLKDVFGIDIHDIYVNGLSKPKQTTMWVDKNNELRTD